MSYRNNASGGYYARNSGPPSGRGYRHNAMTSPAQSGNVRLSGSQSRNNQLYMGDLDPSWDENVIRSIWNSLGESNVEIKLMWNNRNAGVRSHLGYCFVQFSSRSQASNALLKNGMAIPGYPSKTLRLNWSSASGNSADGSNEISVFVGDLAPNVTESDLFELFISKCPSTSNAKVMYDQVTGVSKGYAFVRFGNQEDQQRALQEMTGTFLKGRAIRVGSAGHQNQRNRNGPGLENKLKGLNATVSSPKPANISSTNFSQFILPTQQLPPLNSFTDRNNTTLFVSSLSHMVTENELKAFFQPFGNVIYAKLPENKQCGFVQYVDRASAEMAILKLQGFPIRGSRIKISWGRPAKPAVVIKEELANNGWQYQPQPSIKQPTYGYVTPSIDFITPAYEVQNSFPNGDEEALLLPGYSGCELIDFPSSASGLQSIYESTESNCGPHTSIRNDDSFIEATQASLNRLEDASNGYVFA